MKFLMNGIQHFVYIFLRYNIMPTQYEWFNCNECYDGQCYDCEIKQEELDKQIAKEEKEKEN